MENLFSHFFEKYNAKKVLNASLLAFLFILNNLINSVNAEESTQIDNNSSSSIGEERWPARMGAISTLVMAVFTVLSSITLCFTCIYQLKNQGSDEKQKLLPDKPSEPASSPSASPKL